MLPLRHHSLFSFFLNSTTSSPHNTMIHITPYINPSMLYHPNQQQPALRSPFEYEQLLWRENWCPGKYLKV